MIEFETLGALTSLAPGRTATHVEYWTVLDGRDKPDTDAAYVKLRNSSSVAGSRNCRLRIGLATWRGERAIYPPMSPLRLVFFGSDAIALPLLDWLGSATGRAHAEVIGVFTQPDRPVGRGQKITANAIKLWAVERNLPVFQPEKVTDDVRAQLAALAPDVSLVMAYGHILRDAFIATPRLGTLNLHTSLLPKYRGASPIQTAVACGEKRPA